jgi:hypothetical protein
MTNQDRLHLCVIKSPSDFEPWGSRSRENDYGPDCSCSCKFFVRLNEELASDWGVCVNHQSPRKGLLTFEHQGCKFYEEKDQYVD